MWPWLLPVASSLYGGYEAYRRSGGDLGATALGAGIGAAVPGAFRAAGTALAELPAVSSLLGKASTGLGEAALTGNLAARGLAQEGLTGAARSAALSGTSKLAGLAGKLAVPAAVGGGAAALGGLLAPSIAGAVAPAVAAPLQKAASGAAGMGVGRPGIPGDYPFEQGAIPQTGPLGPTAALGSSPWEIADPTGRFAAGRTMEEMEGDVQIRNLKKLLAAETPYTEGAKKAEFMRNMAAAGIRQNIATQAAMLQNAQRTAQQIGANAASQMGSALAAQYQYS